MLQQNAESVEKEEAHGFESSSPVLQAQIRTVLRTELKAALHDEMSEAQNRMHQARGLSSLWQGALVVALITVLGWLAALGLGIPSTTWTQLTFKVACAAVGLIAVFGLVIAVRLLLPVFFPDNPAGISLACILSEEKGEPGTCGNATVSRFQFLLFTFVIAAGFILILVHNLSSGTQNPAKPGWPWPEMPGSILALLGISGGSALIANGVATSLKAEKVRVAGQIFQSNAGSSERSLDEIMEALNRV